MQLQRNSTGWEAAAALGALAAIVFCFALMAHSQPCYLYEQGQDKHGKPTLIPAKLPPNAYWDRFCRLYRLVTEDKKTYVEVLTATHWERKEWIDCRHSYLDRDGRFYYEARSVSVRWPCPYVAETKVAAESTQVK